MKGPLFDYDNGDFMFQTSDSTAINSEGHMMMRMGDNMAMDMESGDIHFVSGWKDNDDNEPN